MFIKFTNTGINNICKKCGRDLTSHRSNSNDTQTSIQTCRESILYDVMEIRARLKCEKITVIINDTNKSNFNKESIKTLFNILNALIYTQSDIPFDAKLSRNADYLAVSINGRVIHYPALLSVLLYLIKITEVLDRKEFIFDATESKAQVNNKFTKYIDILLKNIKSDPLYDKYDEDGENEDTTFYSFSQIYDELEEIKDSLIYLFKSNGIQKLTWKYNKENNYCSNCYNHHRDYNGILEFTEAMIQILNP